MSACRVSNLYRNTCMPKAIDMPVARQVNIQYASAIKMFILKKSWLEKSAKQELHLIFSSAVTALEEGPGGPAHLPAPCLCLAHTKAQRAEKIFFETGPLFI